MKSIAIISLGWLGKQLYFDLQPLFERVCGAYLNFPKGLENEFQYDFTKEVLPREIKSSSTIILNLPPSQIKNPTHLKRFLENVGEKRVIFISSTSVYGDQGEVNEDSLPLPLNQRGKLMLNFESIVKEKCENYLIIRSAGQFGKGRHPGISLSGKRDLKGGEQPINMVSRDDLISLILKSIDDMDRKVINAVNTNHPKKREFYTEYCLEQSLEVPHFRNEEVKESKIVSTIYKDYEINSKLK